MAERTFYDYGMMEEYESAKVAGDKRKMKDVENKFYFQYIDLAHKMKWNLVSRLKKTPLSGGEISDATENYESEAYDVCLKALSKVKLERIPQKVDKKGKRSWTFYYQYWGYLNAYNRDTAKKIIDEGKTCLRLGGNLEHEPEEAMRVKTSVQNKAALSSHNLYKESPEDTFIKEQDKKIFWGAVDNCLNKKFTPTQVKLWNIRKGIADGHKISIGEICKQLNISVGQYHKELNSMEKTFKSELSNY